MEKKDYVKQTGDNRFYVYLHREADTGRPFYVGKGSKDRAWEKYKRSEFWNNVVESHGGYSVDIVFDNLLEVEAFQIEKDTILELEYFGYRLTNLTRGGDGPAGYVFSEESRNKMSQAQKASPKAFAARKISALKRKGSKASDETKQKCSLALKGKKKSEAHIKRAAEAKRCTTVYTFARVSTGECFTGTRLEAENWSGLNRIQLSRLFGKNASVVTLGVTLIGEGYVPKEASTYEEKLFKARNHKARSQITRQKMSKSATGRVRTPEHQAKLADSTRDKTLYVFVNETTNEVFVGDRQSFVEHTGFLKASVSGLFSTSSRKNSLYGWVVKDTVEELKT